MSCPWRPGSPVIVLAIIVLAIGDGETRWLRRIATAIVDDVDDVDDVVFIDVYHTPHEFMSSDFGRQT